VIRRIKLIEYYFVILLLFLLPTQLAYHFWPPWSFVFGIRIDLLSPSIYFTDLLVLILVALNLEIIKKYKKYFCLILVFAFINSFFSALPLLSLYKWLKIVEFVFVIIYFVQVKAISLSLLVNTLFYSLVFFSLIGIAQFVNRGTVGGILYYLGERSFSQSTPGIALIALNGVEYMRAYSTFSHPNSLAGFLGAGILFVLLSGKLKKNFFNILGVFLILTCFVLSFSLSSYLGIFFVFSFYLFSKNKNIFTKLVLVSFFVFMLSSLLFPVISPWVLNNFSKIGQNIVQRIDLAYISGQMIGQRFLIGQGLGTFIANIPTYKGIYTYSWLLQPVHNIFLLIFSEIGVFGLLAFYFLVSKTLKTLVKYRRLYLLLSLIYLLFTGLFDHYSLTLQQNLLLFSIFIGISFRAKIA
jgi:O-antigen ligase